MNTDLRNTKGMAQRSKRFAVFLVFLVFLPWAASALSCGPERPDQGPPSAPTELMLSPSNPQIAQGTFEQFSLRERLPSGRIVERRTPGHRYRDDQHERPGDREGQGRTTLCSPAPPRCRMC